MATSKNRTRTKARRPPPSRTADLHRYGWIAGIAVIGAAAVGAFLLAREQAQQPGKAVVPPPSGLPQTQDYHSLLVDPVDPRRLFLGTHGGLYESVNGGRSWAFASLEGQDAMNLAHGSSPTLWTAGHNVFAKSPDGGATWTDVRPKGLPGLDIHAFAIDPADPDRLYAAVAGEGLYTSADGGTTFVRVSEEVGPGIFGLAAMPDGRILAADPRRGLFETADDGRTWRPTLEQAIVGVAVAPEDPRRVLAAGAPGVFLSGDGGESWKLALPLPDGAGPVAWSQGETDIAYAVGFDGKLYRTEDGGSTWAPVT